MVGVLPDDGDGRTDPCAVAALDLALFTGMGQARNVINALSSEVMVVCGAGGAGTLAEAAHALKAGRPLVLLAVPEPWRALLSSQGGAVRICDTVAEAIEAIELLLAAAQVVGDQPAANRDRHDQRLPVALVQLCASDDAAANLRREIGRAHV